MIPYHQELYDLALSFLREIETTPGWEKDARQARVQLGKGFRLITDEMEAAKYTGAKTVEAGAYIRLCIDIGEMVKMCRAESGRGLITPAP